MKDVLIKNINEMCWPPDIRSHAQIRELCNWEPLSIVAILAELAASGAGGHSILPIFCSAGYIKQGDGRGEESLNSNPVFTNKKVLNMQMKSSPNSSSNIDSKCIQSVLAFLLLKEIYYLRLSCADFCAAQWLCYNTKIIDLIPM